MPGAQCARSLACKVKKHASKSPRSRQNTRHSRTRMVLTVYGALSPVIGLDCHRHLARLPKHRRET